MLSLFSTGKEIRKFVFPSILSIYYFGVPANKVASLAEYEPFCHFGPESVVCNSNTVPGTLSTVLGEYNSSTVPGTLNTVLGDTLNF